MEGGSSKETAGDVLQRRRFGMLRSFAPADALTLSNAACGTLIVLMCLNHLDTGEGFYLWIALGLFPAALLLDVLDGWVARRFRRGSVLGAELDSLADIVSFGLGPAVLVALLAAAWWSGAVGPDLWLGEFRLLGMSLHPMALTYLLMGSAMISSRLRVPKP